MNQALNLLEKKVLFSGFILFIIIAILSEGYHHIDEHFQILEFASLKLGLTGAENLPWEYHYKMRPAFQPFVTVMVYKFFAWFSITNPFFIATVLRVMSSILSVVALFLIYLSAKEEIEDEKLLKFFLFLTYSLWFVLYNGVRYSSENWSGIFFGLAYAIYLLKPGKKFTYLLFTGFLLGMAFVTRYQAAFLAFGLIAWMIFVKRENKRSLFMVAFGIIAALLIGILIDWWYYGEFTFPAINYFKHNIIEDRVSNYGIESWYYYFTEIFNKAIPPLSIVLVTSVLLFFLRKNFKHPLFWSLLPFILIHFFIGHKELRFLFPALCFLPVILIKSYLDSKDFFVKNQRFWTIVFKLVIVTNLAGILVVIIRPADSQISLYKTIYKQYKEPITLYYLNEFNPYLKVKDISFYKRSVLTTMMITNPDQIPNEKSLLVVFGKDKSLVNETELNLIYSSFPESLLEYNFNNWIDRTPIWYLYEITPSLEQDYIGTNR